MKSADSSTPSSQFGPGAKVRSILLAIAVAAMASGALFGHARAQLDGTMMGLGSRIMKLPGFPAPEVRTVRLNGLDVSLRTGVVDAPLDEVLGHYRSACATPAAGDYGDVIAALGTRSRSTQHDGYVACVDTGAGDLATLVKRLSRFSSSWDLADIGALRYVYATRADEQPKRRTFVLTMWAEGALALRDFLPLGRSDAGGSDPFDVPRPPDSQRILSATEMSAPSGVYIYLARGAVPAELAGGYRAALRAQGWRILERHSGESLEIDGIRILHAEKDGRTLSVLTHAKSQSTTVVTLLVSEAA